jgi:hypothetical protein
MTANKRGDAPPGVPASPRGPQTPAKGSQRKRGGEADRCRSPRETGAHRNGAKSKLPGPRRSKASGGRPRPAEPGSETVSYLFSNPRHFPQVKHRGYRTVRQTWDPGKPKPPTSKDANWVLGFLNRMRPLLNFICSDVAHRGPQTENCHFPDPTKAERSSAWRQGDASASYRNSLEQ